jgi:hypothetical protein
MANDIERVDVSDNKDVLPEELSSFDRLVWTDTKRLYGEDNEGHRRQIQDLGQVVIHFAAKASGAEVEVLNRPARAQRGGERNQTPPDIEAMVQRIVEQRINAAIQPYEQRNQEQQAELERLRAEIERLQKPLHERLDEAFGGNWIPRQEGIAVARRGNDGFMEDGWTTDSQPYEKEGKWYIRVKKDNNEEEAELTTLSRVPETPPAPNEDAQRQQQRVELESRIDGYEGVNRDNLYQTYRQHLQHAANTDEREAFANDASREAAMAQIRAQEVRDYINSMNEQQRNALPASAARDLITWIELRDAQEPPIIPAAEQENPNPDGLPAGSRPVYQRRGWLGRGWDRVRRRPAREYVATGVYAPPEGGYVRVVDGEAVEVLPAEVEGRDGPARALGAAALIGVGALAIYELLEHKYIGHSPTREARHNGLYPFFPHKHGGHFGFGHLHRHGAGNNLPNGTHTDFYNPALGHRRTGVEASSTINLVGRPGNEHLVDGHKVLLGGHKVEWDSQGKLSVWDKLKLRKEGYDIGWGKLQDKIRGINRFKTIVIKR